MAARAARALVGWWLLASAAAVQDRFQFGAMETGPALSPRLYHASPAVPLRNRQFQCTAGLHPCNEIGAVGNSVCCANTEYCIVNPTATSQAGCCQIGATCGASPCSENQYICASTATITSAGSTITSVEPACCSRQCTATSMYGCPSSLGGGCCSYDSVCRSNRQCVSTVMPTSSSSPLVPVIPAGCTTSQISCASSLGGGCCAATQSCTLFSSSAHCADVTTTPTGSGITEVEPGSTGGLSTGAKAGIGVGVVVAFGLLIGAATWWCLRRRRRSDGSSSSRRPRPTGVIGALVGGGPSGIGRGEMSDNDTTDIVSRGGPLPGMAHDYFGPDAVPGPYTDNTPPDTSAVTTPGVEHRDRLGAFQPHDPDDIAVPVEIDSRISPSQQQQQQPPLPPLPSESPGDISPAAPPPPVVPQPHYPDDGRFELYGSSPTEYVSPSSPEPPDDRAR